MEKDYVIFYKKTHGKWFKKPRTHWIKITAHKMSSAIKHAEGVIPSDAWMLEPMFVEYRKREVKDD